MRDCVVHIFVKLSRGLRAQVVACCAAFLFAAALTAGPGTPLAEDDFAGPSAANWDITAPWEAEAAVPAIPIGNLEGSDRLECSITTTLGPGSYEHIAELDADLDAGAFNNIAMTFKYQLIAAAAVSEKHTLSLESQAQTPAVGAWFEFWRIDAASASTVATLIQPLLPIALAGETFRVRIVARGPNNGDDLRWLIDDVDIFATNVVSAGAITPTTLADAEVGTAYTPVQLLLDGALAGGAFQPNFAWTWQGLPEQAGGGLPGTSDIGLEMSDTGEISGTPTAGAAGDYFFRVTCRDATTQDESSIDFVLTIDPHPNALTLDTTPPPDATENQAYSYTFTASGGTPPYTWALSASTLPGGFDIDANTGELTGTFTSVPGAQPVFDITVTDSAATPDSVTATFTLDVVAAGSPLAVATTVLPDAEEGQAYSFQFVASGGAGGNSWALVSGTSLPSGLTLGTGGLLSGTPAIGTAGDVDIEVEVTDASSATASAILPLHIDVATPVVVPPREKDKGSGCSIVDSYRCMIWIGLPALLGLALVAGRRKHAQ